MPNPVLVDSGLLIPGLLTTFSDAYEMRYKKVAARMGLVMDLGLPSSHRIEYYGSFETAPYPRRWQRGTTAQSKPFKSFSWTTENYIYQNRIEWFEEDLDDEQTRKLYNQARVGGENFATLSERIFTQMILGSTDADLLPAVPNAADGTAAFAASRFGVGVGNIVGGSGIATSVAVRADLWTAVELTRRFQDTESQPLWDQDITNGVIVVMYNVDNEEVFREAFLQGRTLESVGTAGTDLAATAVTNTILESGLQIQLWPTQRITDNDWFVFFGAAPHGLVYQQTRQALREVIITPQNSDRARDERISGVQWDARFGFGFTVPYQSIKVNN